MTDTTNTLNLPARELATLIRQREVSPVDVVQAALDRITANKALNAFITVTAEQALDEARRAEAAIMRKEAVGPLHGVPFSVKDLTLTKGVRTTMGSAIYEDYVPNEDAVAVARSKAAGAILIGKTTTPEFGAKQSTDAPLFGQTLNPINPDYTCGASSGGAAVAIATGMGALALGTDGGGSIRIPASCCGIVGLKATLGRIPNLQASDLIGVNSYVGPMTRDIADARLYFEVLQGADARDPWGKGLLRGVGDSAAGASGLGYKTHDHGDFDLSGLRVAYLPSAGNYVHSEVKAATDKVAEQLRQAGAIVEEITADFVEFEQAFLVILESLIAMRVQPHLERYQDRLDPSIIRLAKRGREHSAIDLHHATQARTTCYQRLENIFSQYDILLSPTVSAPPLPVDTDPNGIITIEGREVGTIRGAWYPTTYPMNLAGHPALSMPCGTSSEGLPIGMQLCGPWYSEGLLLDVAEVVEGMVG